MNEPGICLATSRYSAFLPFQVFQICLNSWVVLACQLQAREGAAARFQFLPSDFSYTIIYLTRAASFSNLNRQMPVEEPKASVPTLKTFNSRHSKRKNHLKWAAGVTVSHPYLLFNSQLRAGEALTTFQACSRPTLTKTAHTNSH
jgi:hypothetical protein